MKRRFTTLLALLLMSGIVNASQTPATERLYLSGKDRADAVPWEFRCSAGAKAGVWSTIPVPSNWEMQGFGTLSYCSLTPSEKGEYKHRFTVPSSWQGRRISLVFDGAMTDTAVVINGKSAGPLHQGGFYRFRYDVTNLVQLGVENLLEVQVDETSGNAGVNRAERTGDYWNFGGIYRPVWLEALPNQSIDRVAIDARADGSFSLDAFLSPQVKTGNLVARILAADGAQMGKPFTTPVTGTKTRIQTHVDDIKLWSAETPHLYTVELSLVDDDQVLHRVQQRFGFRTFEVRLGDGLYLNGHRIVLQGANRHSLNAENGRSLSEANLIEDVRLMKGMNMNAVRCSHYPPDERFLELCDVMGLYVLDELAGWQKGYDATVGRALLVEMLQRDVNHPSILFWDNGNEGGWNRSLDGDFAKWDIQGRTVLHPWEAFNGINTAHYRTFQQAYSMCQGMTVSDKGNAQTVTPPLIYMPTEFQHGLYDGGAGAGLENMWALMRASPLLGGGFLWALLDEGIVRPETGKIDVAGNSGPDGILGPRREKEASYYTIKELWSPLVVSERSIPENFDGVLSLENRYSFTNASACRITWELRRLSLPSAGAAMKEEILSSARGKPPSITPGTSGKIALRLPANWREADVLALRADDPSGHELWTWTWPLPGLARIQSIPTNGSTDISQVTANEVSNAVVVQVGDLALSFDKATGYMTKVTRAGREFSITNGPRPVAGQANLVSLKTRSEGNDVVVSARYEGSLRKVEWLVRANGWIDCSYEYTGVAGSLYEGICFDYPAEKVRAKSWVGYGPYRVWQNRLRGVSLGAWHNVYNDTITGWSGWEYPEFKGCFAGVRWMTLDTTEGDITMIPRGNDLYIQVLTPASAPEKLRMKEFVSLPNVGFAFLHVIPPIGDKFHRSEQNGPQGMPLPLKPSYTGKFSLRFGP
jgi:hypothetical protein